MKQHYPATARNREAITDVLATVLPKAGVVLEVASGSGEHVVHLAKRFPELAFQPSDIDPVGLASIDAWADELERSNVRPAITLDASSTWSLTDVAAVLNINMIHISPWTACVGVIENSSRVLRPNGLLFFYGPFIRDGVVTAPSNLRFDQSLRGRNPSWGIRSLDLVTETAREVGLELEQVLEMPANNVSVVFRRR